MRLLATSHVFKFPFRIPCRPACPLTLTLSVEQPVAFSTGAGVSARGVDAHLSVVTLMRVCLAFVNVCNEKTKQEMMLCRQTGGQKDLTDVGGGQNL